MPDDEHSRTFLQFGAIAYLIVCSHCYSEPANIVIVVAAASARRNSMPSECNSDAFSV